MKQDSAKRDISVCKGPPANNKKSALLENIVQQALTHPKAVLKAPFLMPPACGMQGSALTVQQGRTALNQAGPTPQDCAGKDFIVLLDPK